VTIFAGIFSRHARAPISDAACDALRRALSRQAHEPAQEFRDERVFLAKVDLHIFDTPAFLVRDGASVALLAGEPLLRPADGATAATRSDDLARLQREWDDGDWSALRRTRGVFCAVHYSREPCLLTLVTDKLGLRPLYYWIDDDRVLFATALRILEQHPDVPKRMDLRAVTEMANLGVPLADRTPYAGIRVLRAAEVLRVSPSLAQGSCYWRWDEIPPSSRPEPELLSLVYERFQAAVACRLRGDTAAVAFLSGGLDSRCIVAALRDQRAAVHSFNFSMPRTQDRALGAAFARAAGAVHHERPTLPEPEPPYHTLLANALRELALEPAPRHPRRVWSGDGGSVALGHVYLTRTMIDRQRAGDREGAIAAYLEQQRAAVLRRLLQPPIAAALDGILKRGVREELADTHCADPGRALHIFLLLNDQRRHLTRHFEDIDLHQLELQLPFFDSDFLEAVLTVPIDRCLYHAFYAKWLDRFPPVVTAVPWQTYPGHVPCPLPTPERLHYQWTMGRDRALRASFKRAQARRAAEMLRAERFPRDVLNKGVLRLAGWLHRAGIRDYGYVIRQASLYYTYWLRSSGDWVAPPAGPTPDVVAR